MFFLSNIIRIKKINKGKNVRLSCTIRVSNPQNISIGDNTYINGGMLLAGKESYITIGSNCLISYNVHIRTSSHSYKNKNILINQQGLNEKDIVIEEDVWLGYGVQIMPGVTIRKGTVVAAGAVVTKDTESYSVVGGIPAKKISERL